MQLAAQARRGRATGSSATTAAASSRTCSSGCSTIASASCPASPTRSFSAPAAAAIRSSPTVDTFGLSARVPDGGIADGLTALEIEARRVQQFGFTASELDRAKRWMAAFYERAYNERDKSESGSFAQEYLNYFLNERTEPGHRLRVPARPAAAARASRSRTSRRWRGRGSPATSRVVLAVIAAERRRSRADRSGSADAAIGEGDKVAVTPWSDGTTDARAASTNCRSRRGRIAARAARHRRHGREVRQRCRGVAQADRLQERPGAVHDVRAGRRVARVAATTSCRRASPRSTSGCPALAASRPSISTRCWRASWRRASPFIPLSTHGIQGSAAPADLETALQLLYQEFNAPGDDPEAFALMKRQLEAAVANRGRQPGPGVRREDRRDQHLGSLHVEAADRRSDRARSIARRCWRSTRRVLERRRLHVLHGRRVQGRHGAAAAGALCRLPAVDRRARRRSSRTSASVSRPAIQRARVEKGREPRSQTVISFFADPSFDPMEQERIIAATAVLETVLRDSLREDLGQTYTVSVGLHQSPPQRGDGYIAVNFGAAPENIDAMTERVLQEVKKLQDDGPSADLVSKAKEGAQARLRNRAEAERATGCGGCRPCTSSAGNPATS